MGKSRQAIQLKRVWSSGIGATIALLGSGSGGGKSGPPNSDVLAWWLGSAGHPQDIAQCMRAECPSTPQHTYPGLLSFNCGSAAQEPKHHKPFLPTISANSPPKQAQPPTHHLPAPPHFPSA
ncbi:hypothetical protein HaLaN_01611 [Haematococcus lacustris]|uniref:Uncharacterized protein n=1 Tax=Haematococcus lacustris TaxID=44745 RepID=A0A699YC24_HAELA|nr:hypothetical protein HaLaN_01611 [Haematococcus lacustris]